MLSFLLFFACASKKVQVQDSRVHALNLCQKLIIADGHVDLPYRLRIQNFRLEKEYLGIPIKTDKGDFDYERSKLGGLDAPFMSIFVPARLQKEAGASKMLADSLIDMVEGIVKNHPNKFAIAKSPKEVELNFSRTKISLPLGMENGSPLEEDLDNVHHFRKRGVSYITLTHSKVNKICDSSYDTIRLWNGLSPFGERVVKEMNKAGIMIDISHVSDSTFYDVIKLTKTPVIASHSSCRKFTPGFERNMSDDMIKALGKNGGMIMINFGSIFIDMEKQKARDSLNNIYFKVLEKRGIARDSSLAETIRNGYFRNNPAIWSDMEIVVDHIDHVVKVAGINHVGFGSDFDGVGDSLPRGLKDVSDFPNLIEELIKRGYSDSDIEKICFGNLKRVWNKVLDYSNTVQ